MDRRTILLGFAATLLGGSAMAEELTLAERRAQLVGLSEKGEAAPRASRRPPASGRDFRAEEPGTIVIETGKRVLHYVGMDGEVVTYPIAVGREGAQWRGTTRVIGKKKDPEWRPTPNMRKRNPKLPAVVRPGPSNPLGVRAIYLAEGYLRIHGTNDPSSIGKAVSSGCFRMHNEDVIELFPLVESGAKVVVM